MGASDEGRPIDVRYQSILHAFDQPSRGSWLPEGGRGEQLATKEVRWCYPIILCSIAEPPGSTATLLRPSFQVIDRCHCLGMHEPTCLMRDQLVWEGSMLNNLSHLTGYE